MQSDAIRCTTRVRMLLELGSLKTKHDSSQNMKYLYIINECHFAIGEGGTADEFKGRARLITDKIGALNTRFDTFDAHSVKVEREIAEIKC